MVNIKTDIIMTEKFVCTHSYGTTPFTQHDYYVKISRHGGMKSTMTRSEYSEMWEQRIGSSEMEILAEHDRLERIKEVA